MKNIYKHIVQAQCPVNPSDTDLYKFKIKSNRIIEVEKIIAFFDSRAGNKQIFQEELTRQCAVALGAKVISVGIHSNVKVKCIAP